MLWKKLRAHTSHYQYVAVLEAEEVGNRNMLYGQREFRLMLADGTTVKHTFEGEEYQQWWSSFLKGGQVVNP
ncbi:hypothetical protein [Pseudomonas batumici]|uniref:hypothetical protein n=1 Tax=Pseudomonas batumici TaxID=226910 RepID=UPI00058A3794|nr:hypothetical protein [Pseudomonas batumici]